MGSLAVGLSPPTRSGLPRPGLWALHRSLEDRFKALNARPLLGPWGRQRALPKVPSTAEGIPRALPGFPHAGPEVGRQRTHGQGEG